MALDFKNKNKVIGVLITLVLALLGAWQTLDVQAPEPQQVTIALNDAGTKAASFDVDAGVDLDAFIRCVTAQLRSFEIERSADQQLISKLELASRICNNPVINTQY